MSRKSAFVSEVQQNATDMIDAYNRLRANLREYQALDYGNSNLITPEDLQGSSAEADIAAIAAVLGTTVPAIEEFLALGHSTNLYKLKK